MAIGESGRPVPEPDEASAPFFDAAQRGELALQQCATCGAWMWPVKPRCIGCWSAAVEWKTASGRATVYSYAVMHGDFPGFDSPYVLATIETDEGVRFTVNLADVGPDEVAVGMPVQVTAVRLTADVAVPGFVRAVT
jgi:uncharacterized OB-fold protein